MDNQDWSQLGDEVKNIVQSAVENRDYQNLSRDLQRTLNTALDQVGKTVDQTLSQMSQRYQTREPERRNGFSGGPAGPGNRAESARSQSGSQNGAGSAAGQSRQAWGGTESTAGESRQASGGAGSTAGESRQAQGGAGSTAGEGQQARGGAGSAAGQAQHAQGDADSIRWQNRSGQNGSASGQARSGRTWEQSQRERQGRAGEQSQTGESSSSSERREQEDWEQRQRRANWERMRREQQQNASPGARTYRNPGSAWDTRSSGSRAGSSSQTALRVKNERYASTGGMTGAGVLMTVFGGILTGSLGIGLLALTGVMTIGQFVNVGLGIGTGFTAAFTAASATLLGKGISTLGRTKRFRRYVEKLGGRDYCSIEELQDVTGKSQKYVQKDLKKMIDRRMFRQGHLDKQGTCLMVTDQAYDQYMIAQNELEQREQEKLRMEKEEAERRDAWEKSSLSEEAKKVIQEGSQYLDQIKKCNEAIPGEDISQKISRMELVIGKIFAHVEEHPELISDLRKFMNYYLPTTVKLLNAYAEMDAQPVQGPNIQNSKKEIEDTLDIINQAFENLLDGFFKDTAWDISSDISVLQTMLAQEGLTRGKFDQTKKED